jgi:hypothetical protein
MTALLKAVMDLKPAKVDAASFIPTKIMSLPGPHGVAMELPRKAIAMQGGSLSTAGAATQQDARTSAADLLL